jgi:hypothetical protein
MGQAGGDLVLHIQEVGALLVEAFGPQMRAALRINELRVESDPFARVLHAAFEDVSHAELAADLAGVDRFALIGKSRVARDRENARAPREIRRQRFGDAVDKGIVSRAAADVDEGQDHQGEPRRRGFAGFGGGCRLAFRARSRCRLPCRCGQLRLDRRARVLP